MILLLFQLSFVPAGSSLVHLPPDTQSTAFAHLDLQYNSPIPARRREQSLPNLELIKHARDAALNTIHPQGSLKACIHIQMTSVHSKMERSELLITFEEHRNIWTRTSFAPVFAALSTASAAAVAYSRSSH